MSIGVPCARHAAARSFVWRWYSGPSSPPPAQALRPGDRPGADRSDRLGQPHLLPDRAGERAVRPLQLGDDREVVEAGRVDDVDRRAVRAPRRREVVRLAVVLGPFVGATCAGATTRRPAWR